MQWAVVYCVGATSAAAARIWVVIAKMLCTQSGRDRQSIVATATATAACSGSSIYSIHIRVDITVILIVRITNEMVVGRAEGVVVHGLHDFVSQVWFG